MKTKRAFSDSRIFYVYLKFDIHMIPRWVGKGKGKRAFDHERSCDKHWNRQMRAMLVDAKSLGKEIPTVFLSEDLTEKEALDQEKLWISVIGRGKHGPLYNWTDGGEGISGHIHSEETRQKLRGRKRSPEMIEAQKAAFKRMSTEAKIAMKEKQRLAKLGRKLSDDHKAKIGISQPKTRHADFGKAVSLGKMGHIQSEETKRKISETKLKNKRRMTDEERENLSRHHKGIPKSDAAKDALKARWAERKISPEYENFREKQRAAWVIRKAKKLINAAS